MNGDSKNYVSETSLQKRVPTAIKEKGQYLIAFGVVASMLVVANMPIFVIMFFGVFAFFLYKMFSSGPRNEVRDVFEFYLTANEMLRDDDRKWYGFELRETIERGEGLIHRLSAAPPLVHFSVGALYNKIGDHKAAVKHLAFVVENNGSDEKAFVYPTPELRNYVKVLRKIEREPADAPLTSAAIRSLERARKLRGAVLLEESRTAFSSALPLPQQLPQPETEHGTETRSITEIDTADDRRFNHEHSAAASVVETVVGNGRRQKLGETDDSFSNRKSISEVLHDIYDTKVG